MSLYTRRRNRYKGGGWSGIEMMMGYSAGAGYFDYLELIEMEVGDGTEWTVLANKRDLPFDAKVREVEMTRYVPRDESVNKLREFFTFRLSSTIRPVIPSTRYPP